MKLKLCNTPHGLVPIYDEDLEEKKKLKLGEYYTADIRLLRNLKFHNRAMTFITLAWEYLPEKTQNGFRSLDGFRQYATVAAGWYTVYYNPRLKEFTEIPKSWSFGSMDEAEFHDFYERLKDVVWGLIHKRVSEEEFEARFKALLQ